ncbi:MAG: hypothetical protein JJE44_02800 [Flavobacteriaceae bacterium]|nr:hypothetical protein [Flavobacteriaceae bacterium]
MFPDGGDTFYNDQLGNLAKDEVIIQMMKPQDYDGMSPANYGTVFNNN